MYTEDELKQAICSDFGFRGRKHFGNYLFLESMIGVISGSNVGLETIENIVPYLTVLMGWEVHHTYTARRLIKSQEGELLYFDGIYGKGFAQSDKPFDQHIGRKVQIPAIYDDQTAVDELDFKSRVAVPVKPQSSFRSSNGVWQANLGIEGRLIVRNSAEQYDMRSVRRRFWEGGYVVGQYTGTVLEITHLPSESQNRSSDGGNFGSGRGRKRLKELLELLDPRPSPVWKPIPVRR